MPLVAAAFLDDVDNAAHRAAVFGLVAARLHLDFLDKFEHDVLSDTAVLNFRSVQAFDEVSILGVAGTVDLEAVVAPRVIARALQGFLTGARSKWNKRLIGTSLRNVVDNLLRDVYNNVHRRHIHERRSAGNLNGFGLGTNFQGDFYSGEFAHQQLNRLLLVGTKVRR